MKLTPYILPLLALGTINSYAAEIVKLKNAQTAVLNVFTYDANGKLLNSGVAFYIGEQGEAVASYHFFKGAYKAEVVDFKGKKHAVQRIIGANASTDLVKFKVDNGGNNDYFSITNNAAVKGAPLYMLNYTTKKKQPGQVVNISSDEPYNNYRYYHIDVQNDKANMGRPLVDAEGSLMGITQKNNKKNAEYAYALDSRFINELRATAKSAFNTDLLEINIPKALPNNAKDALTYLYMLPSIDTLTCRTAYNDFITSYPNMAEGYVNRANYYLKQGDLAHSEQDFLLAAEKAASDTTSMTPDAVHYQFSTALYKVALSPIDSATTPSNWTLQRAEEEASKAYSIKPHTLYLMHKGKCQYAQRNYDGSYQIFSKVCTDKQFASADTYYSAALALEKTGRDSMQVITLLDSCITHLPQPVNARYAQYYLERSRRLIQAGHFRKAVFDYNEYEKIIGPRNLNANFYYLRYQAETEAHMYQQALDDIRTAIATSKEPIPFRLEEAALLLSVGEFKQAIEAAQKLLHDLPENPDCYKIIGVAYGEQGNKTEAIKNLQKAKNLGDTSVETFIKKYQ